MKKDIEQFQIKPDISITVALKRISEVGEKIVFVVDKEKRLLGSLTDGDVRRWILKNGNLNANVENIYNSTPIYLDNDYDVKTVKDLMIKNKVERIPVVDKYYRIQNILFWEDMFSDEFRKTMPKLDIPVIIMAGGKGSRLDPLTKILPKALVPFGDKPISEVVIDKFTPYGCKDFYFIVNYKSAMIKSYFDNSNCPYRVNYIYEDKPLGTAGGLKLLPKMKSDTFFVSNCDVIINADYKALYDFHKKDNYAISLVGCVRNFVIPYGIVEMKNGGMLNNIIEKPEYHFMANTGLYVFEREVLDLIPDDKAFDMNILINAAKNEGSHIGVYPVSEKAWIDVGEWEAYHNILREINP